MTIPPVPQKRSEPALPIKPLTKAELYTMETISAVEAKIIAGKLFFTDVHQTFK